MTSLTDDLRDNSALWKGRRYYPISQFYQEKFGEKTYKISVSVSETCPNRKGTNGMQTCIFCDIWGSAAYHLERDLPLIEQVRKNKEKIRFRYKAKKFLVYFQSYSNTFERVSRLQEKLEMVLNEEEISGIVLGTRPDCLPKNMLKMLGEISEKTALQIELGAQTFNEEQLKFIRRGHTALQTIEAIQKLNSYTSADLGVHLIFGIPGETKAQLIQTAQLLNNLPINNVKLHNLHVLANTPLLDLYQKNEFVPIELEEYTEKVILFLEHLSPKIAVHRLAATANRHDELIAPAWTKEKMRPVNFISMQLKKQQTWQGKRF